MQNSKSIKKETSAKKIVVKRTIENNVVIDSKVKKIDFLQNVKNLKNFKKLNESISLLDSFKFDTNDFVLKNYYISNSILVIEFKVIDLMSYGISFISYDDTKLKSDILSLSSDLIKDKKAKSLIDSKLKKQLLFDKMNSNLVKIRSSNLHNNRLNFYRLSESNFNKFENSESCKLLERFLILVTNNISSYYKSLTVKTKISHNA